MRLLRPSSLGLIIGLILFVTAFFLPAVRFPPDPGPGQWGPAARSQEFGGYLCAGLTLVASADLFINPKSTAIPAAFIGWINPLVLLYLLTCAIRKLHRARPFIAAAIAVCCASMWIELFKQHATLLVGHYLWIAGIVLILASPLLSRLGNRNHSEPMLTSRT